MNKGGPLGVITGGKISSVAWRHEKKEKENLAAGRPVDEGTGGLVGGLRRLIREVSKRSLPRQYMLTALEHTLSHDSEHAF